MRRLAITLDRIASLENLSLAVFKAARGKRHRPSVARFLMNLDKNLNRLSDRILSEQVPTGIATTFLIRDPKPRVITAACFEDRVLHHAILNLAEPRFEQTLTPVSFACRPGMGVHKAVTRLHRIVRTPGEWRWVVQVDINTFFPSIDHQRLRTLLRSRFKGRPFLALLDRIIACGAPSPGKGLPIGSLTSQHFANAFLDGADRLLLGDPRTRTPIRYMDDIVWFTRTHVDAIATLDRLNEFLRAERGLGIKANPHVGPTLRGISYCGFRIRSAGLFPSRRKLRRYRSRHKFLVHAVTLGVLTEKDAQRSYDNLIATLALTRCRGFRRRLLGVQV